MKRLFLIRYRDGSLGLKYISCSVRNFSGPSKKGYEELGDFKSWSDVKSRIEDNVGLEKFIKLAGIGI